MNFCKFGSKNWLVQLALEIFTLFT